MQVGSRGGAPTAQARDSASNNKKQEPSNMADLGKKYCVNCLADVTNLRLRCTDCPDIELCPECFSAGAEIGNHRRWHGYQQVDGGRFSLWGPEAEGGWTSREEQSLLDAIEQYGFGNWVRLKWQRFNFLLPEVQSFTLTKFARAVLLITVTLYLFSFCDSK